MRIQSSTCVGEVASVAITIDDLGVEATRVQLQLKPIREAGEVAIAASKNDLIGFGVTRTYTLQN